MRNPQSLICGACYTNLRTCRGLTAVDGKGYVRSLPPRQCDEVHPPNRRSALFIRMSPSRPSGRLH